MRAETKAKISRRLKGRPRPPEVRARIAASVRDYLRANPVEPGKPRPGARKPRGPRKPRPGARKPRGPRKVVAKAEKLPQVVLRAIALWEKGDRAESLEDYLARKAVRSKLIANHRFGKTYVVFAHYDPRDDSVFHIGWKPAEANLKEVDYTANPRKMKRLHVLSEFYEEPFVRIIAAGLSWQDARDRWQHEMRQLKGECDDE